jgi:hypothetical protein
VFGHRIDKDRLDTSLVEQDLKRITNWNIDNRHASGTLGKSKMSMACTL